MPSLSNGAIRVVAPLCWDYPCGTRAFRGRVDCRWVVCPASVPCSSHATTVGTDFESLHAPFHSVLVTTSHLVGAYGKHLVAVVLSKAQGGATTPSPTVPTPSTTSTSSPALPHPPLPPRDLRP